MSCRHYLELNPVSADTLARLFYGLEQQPGPKGRSHGISKRLNTLETRGFTAGGQVTELGLRALARHCQARQRGPGQYDRRLTTTTET